MRRSTQRVNPPSATTTSSTAAQAAARGQAAAGGGPLQTRGTGETIRQLSELRSQVQALSGKAVKIEQRAIAVAQSAERVRKQAKQSGISPAGSPVGSPHDWQASQIYVHTPKEKAAALLERTGLGQYTEALQDEGYLFTEDLLLAENGDLHELVVTTKMGAQDSECFLAAVASEVAKSEMVLKTRKIARCSDGRRWQQQKQQKPTPTTSELAQFEWVSFKPDISGDDQSGGQKQQARDERAEGRDGDTDREVAAKRAEESKLAVAAAQKATPSKITVLNTLACVSKQRTPISRSVIVDSEQAAQLLSWVHESEDAAGRGRQKWLRLELVYRASRDGWLASDFHRCSDGHRATVTVVKSSGGFIFGGYADAPWHSANAPIASPGGAFLFSLHGYAKLPPTKMRLVGAQRARAMSGDADCGPVFGGTELWVATAPVASPHRWGASRAYSKEKATLLLDRGK